MKIGLGSAQFGMNYGITNNSGMLKTDTVHQLIDISLSNKIYFLDTSPSYGNAEKIIGKHPNVHQLQICSKIDPIDSNKILPQHIYDLEVKVETSLKNLNVTKLDTLLVHGPEDFLKDGNNLLFNSLVELKKKGLVENIGASVYTSEQVNKIINLFEIDTLQLPINLFDQTLVRNGCIKNLYKKGITIHARSIFLQGLLLCNPESLSNFFDPIKPNLKAFHKYCFEKNTTPLSLAIDYVKSLQNVDMSIVGVTSESELNEIIIANVKNTKSIDWSVFHIDNRQQTNPISWPINFKNYTLPKSV